jgi:hypothetical protein
MNILIKSLDLFAVMILMAATVGCSIEGGDQGSTGATQVLTEHDFRTDPSLCADPERHLIVKFLEHPDSGGT